MRAIKLVDKHLESEARRGAEAWGLYTRFGFCPTRGFSLNADGVSVDADKGEVHQGAPYFEPGVSTWHAIRLSPDTFKPDCAMLEVLDPASTEVLLARIREVGCADPEYALRVACHFFDSLLRRPAFLVTGPRTRDGSGGEPCLLGPMALAILEVDRDRRLLRLSDALVPDAFFTGL
jgi:hypothetical protein